MSEQIDLTFAKSPRVALMQPHFLPWIGYFELMASVDLFIFLDDFQFSRRSWNQRNRTLNIQGQPYFLTIPIYHSQKFEATFCELKPSAEYDKWIIKTQKNLSQTYAKSQYLQKIMPIIQKLSQKNNSNLAELLISLILDIAQYVNIGTKTLKSSDIEYDRKLKKSEKLISILEAVHAGSYFSAAGSYTYMKEDEVFPHKKIDVYFQNHIPIQYSQLNNTGNFISHLSILDCLMNVGSDNIDKYLHGTKKWLTWNEMATLNKE